MKRPTFIAIAALGLSFATGVALADPHGGDHGRDHRNDRGHAVHRDPGHHDDHRRDDRRVDNRHWDHRADRHDHRVDHRPPVRYKVVRYYPPQGYRPYVWYRGARLPAAYYAPRYVVYNYRDYRLAPPPHGYHWVRVNNDVVLAAITTGIVMQVVNGLFY